MIGQLSLERAFRIPGWMSVGELSFLAEKASNCKSIIEIGSYCGKSARAMADNSPEDCKIHCVDPWNYCILWSNRDIQIIDQTNFAMCYCNLADHIKKGKVILHTARWTEFDLNNEIKADFIFIDGDHSYDSVVNDITKAMKHIKSNGIIAGHDYNWETVKCAVDKFFPKIQIEESIWAMRM